MKVIHRGFNFSQDGPGNRLVYHLQGCNLHCPWCSNPESLAEHGSLVVKGKLLEKSCPFGSIKKGVLNRSRCAACIEMPCVKSFESNLELSCVEMETDEVLNEIKRSAKLFFDGGGVTFTGGEPTVQFEALHDLLSRIKALGINTALETNGTHPRLPELFPLVDFLIIDFKHYNSEIHKRVTGMDNNEIIGNISATLDQRSQLLIRIPLVKGFNSSWEDAEHFAELFNSLHPENCDFELLRYHEYGKDKWEKCGLVYEPEKANISDEEFADFRRVFKEHHLNLVST